MAAWLPRCQTGSQAVLSLKFRVAAPLRRTAHFDIVRLNVVASGGGADCFFQQKSRSGAHRAPYGSHNPWLTAGTPDWNGLQDLDALAEKFIDDVKAGRCVVSWQGGVCLREQGRGLLQGCRQ